MNSFGYLLIFSTFFVPVHACLTYYEETEKTYSTTDYQRYQINECLEYYPDVPENKSAPEKKEVCDDQQLPCPEKSNYSREKSLRY